jgi:hypothetical protein
LGSEYPIPHGFGIHRLADELYASGEILAEQNRLRQPEELTYEKEKDPFPKVRAARERVQMSLQAGLTEARACPVRTGLYRHFGWDALEKSVILTAHAIRQTRH